MRILMIGKYPPIQGGVSKSTYVLAHELAAQGNQVFVVTNAFEVEYNYRQMFLEGDLEELEGCFNDGMVKVISTLSPANIAHIPYSPAYSTKLFGASVEIIEKYGCDLIYSHYFEPYALVATQVAKLYNIPVIVRPAGSDIGRLIKHPFLQSSYKWLITNASLILTSKSEIVQNTLKSLGGVKEKFAYIPKEKLWLEKWQNFKFPFDDLLNEVTSWFWSYPLSQFLIHNITNVNSKPIDATVPTIGVYGKIDESKGSFDLLEALANLANQGVQFNFITITTGSIKKLSQYFTNIFNNLELAKRTWILPAIAPWRIPAFIQFCNIVCSLGREFPIEIHTPGILYEVISQNKCLVISKEIIEKQPYNKLFQNNHNVIIVDDPKDTKTLSQILFSMIASPHYAKAIGYNAGKLWAEIDKVLSKQQTLADILKSLCI